MSRNTPDNFLWMKLYNQLIFVYKIITRWSQEDVVFKALTACF